MDKHDESRATFRISFTFNQIDTDPSASVASENYDNSTEDTLSNQVCDLECSETGFEQQQLQIKQHYQQRETTSDQGKQPKSFKYVQPQNHKSSLFVNLSDISANKNIKDCQDSHKETGINRFISPDLNQAKSQTTPPSSSSVDSTNSIGYKFPSSSSGIASTLQDKDTTDESYSSMLGSGCNFITCIMQSSGPRRRSASVTPPRDAETSTSTTRRVSSSNNLSVANDDKALANRSASGNHLTVSGPSSETIVADSDYVRHPGVANRTAQSRAPIDMTVRLDLLGDDEDEENHPADIAGVNVDNWVEIVGLYQSLEDKCRSLEDDIRNWEDQVSNLERKRFDDGVSRILVDKIIRQRRNLRDLDMKIYEHKSRSSHGADAVPPQTYIRPSELPVDSDFAQGHSTSDRNHSADLTDQSASRFGSKIRPGQENTADILDAVPPPGQLQRGDILSRVSIYGDSGRHEQHRNRQQYRRHQQYDN